MSEIKMSSHEEDLDLLLSLRERVLETPPASPSSTHAPSPDPLFADGVLSRTTIDDRLLYENAPDDYLLDNLSTTRRVSKPKPPKRGDDTEVEKFSGLRIRNPLISASDLNNRLSDIRFIRIQAIGNSLLGDSISGCWATVGILTEKGVTKTSSNGKNFSIWKMSCLKESNVSVFLFGDAYTTNSKEPVGTIFALFNANVRKDVQGNGFSLSVFSAVQMLKLGKSADFAICKGKRKDGLACTMAINKSHGIYCKYHASQASQKYNTIRAELKGGNLRTAFRNHLQSEGIYMVDPLADKKGNKLKQPAKVLSVDGLKKALSNAGKVTTNSQSQGIRFLAKVADKLQTRDRVKEPDNLKQVVGSMKRVPSSMDVGSNIKVVGRQHESKRTKTADQQSSRNLIELDILSSATASTASFPAEDE
ncbi:hypothetical protein H6P81_018566 [Aristolochia fimbriata]|uniref:Zinc finger Mcm10/DnaG-type domain-containing protein n=1 Tax=Aristolochia fimbriata TaxID=158543 RepID=A0AAV7E4I0_ARIFI|nr:hypothetical protein H6P81_018566 [Aristolochia fimbriata]